MINTATTSKPYRITTTDAVVNYVSSQIRNHVYQLGDKLPNEDELAKEIGVGRSSIREAMKILQVYGIVEVRQGGGTFVTDNVAEHMFDFLWFMSGSTYKNYFDFRKTIEIGSLISIYDKLEEKDFTELQQLVDLMDYRNSLDVLVEADRDFHYKLTSFTQNPLQKQIEKMIYQMRIDLLYKTLCRKEDAETTRKAHQKILDALRSKDLSRCISAMLEHLEESERTLQRQ